MECRLSVTHESLQERWLCKCQGHVLILSNLQPWCFINRKSWNAPGAIYKKCPSKVPKGTVRGISWLLQLKVFGTNYSGVNVAGDAAHCRRGKWIWGKLGTKTSKQGRLGRAIACFLKFKSFWNNHHLQKGWNKIMVFLFCKFFFWGWVGWVM